jgi:hypothetical protein
MFEHKTKLLGLFKHLENLGVNTSLEYNMDIILTSLMSSYDGFIVCYLCMGVCKPMDELFDMLMKAETGLLLGADHEMVEDYTLTESAKV